MSSLPPGENPNNEFDPGHDDLLNLDEEMEGVDDVNTGSVHGPPEDYENVEIDENTQTVSQSVPVPVAVPASTPGVINIDEYRRFKPMFEPQPLSLSDKHDKEEELRLLVSSDDFDFDFDMEEELTSEESLMLLKEGLTKTRAQLEELCREAARLVMGRLRLAQMKEPARSKAEKLISELDKNNSLAIKKAEKEVADAAARIKTLESVRKALLAPLLMDIPVDESIPMHAAIKRIFKFNLIPVLSDGTSVDWDRIRHDSFTGAPTLDLSTALSKANKHNLALLAAQAIANFLEAFKTFYEGRLVDLFNILAWRYMEVALKPSKLDEEFKAFIETHPAKTRFWPAVYDYVVELTDLNGFRHLVKSHLF